MRVDAAHPSDFDPVRMEPHRIEDTVCRTDDGVEKFSLNPKSPYDTIKSRGNRKTVSLWSFDNCLQLQNERQLFYFPYYSVQDREINHTEGVANRFHSFILTAS